MQDVLDAISKLLNQQWIDESIRYSDGMTDWEINAFALRQGLWIVGRHPLTRWPPIIEVQFRCDSLREGEVVTYEDGKIIVTARALVLQSLRDGKAQSETWLYLHANGRLEVNVCIASEASEGQ